MFVQGFEITGLDIRQVVLRACIMLVLKEATKNTPAKNDKKSRLK